MFELDYRLTSETRELLVALALRVRVLTIPQIARTWPKAVRAIKPLIAHGLVLPFTAMVHPEIYLMEPVVRWARGDDVPDFAHTSYRLRSRWNGGSTSTKCVIASTAAGRMFGGHGGRYPRESEETHDIHVAGVYLRFRSMSPELESMWVHEDEIKKERRSRRGRLPDALIGKNRVVEFGGAYKKEKLLRFHKFCEGQGLEYEVW